MPILRGLDHSSKSTRYSDSLLNQPAKEHWLSSKGEQYWWVFCVREKEREKIRGVNISGGMLNICWSVTGKPEHALWLNAWVYQGVCVHKCVCVIGCYSTVHTKHSLPASDGCDPAGVAMVLKQASPVSHSRPSITQPPVVRLSALGPSRISLIPSACRRAPAAGLTGPLPAGGWHNCCPLTCMCGRAEVKPLRCSVRPDSYCVIMHLLVHC